MTYRLAWKTDLSRRNNLRERVAAWAKLIAVTGTAQIAVQALGFVSGILVIRMLPVHEYALYTVANTMLGTMTVLADGGIATSVMAQGSKVWQDESRLGAVLATGLALRKRFAFFSLLVAVPILIYLLRKHEASALMSVLLALSLIPAFFSSLSGKLLEIPPKLRQDIAPLQRYQVEANVGRLVLLGLTMFAFPFAAVAVVCAGASQVWNNWRIRPLAARFSAVRSLPDEDVRREMLGMVRSLMPSSIYYCISGQFTLWIISLFGSTEAVAQVGALARFSTALMLLQALATTILVPRFSRLRGGFHDNLRKFLGIEAGLILLAFSIVGICALTPGTLLQVLGEGYEELTLGLVLSVAAGCAQVVSVTTHQLLAGKGLVVPARLFIPMVACTQCLLVLLLRPTDVNSVLLLSLLTIVSVYLIRICYLAWHLRTP